MEPRRSEILTELPAGTMKGHRWFAATYDRMMAGTEKSYLREVREEIVGGAKGTVLEIGAGTGASFPYYAEDVEAIVATEPDPFMLRKAEVRAQEIGQVIELKQAPAEELPFGDTSFDTVVSILVLCTVEDPARALAEVRRVLKPGGELRFYEHARYSNAFGAFWQSLVTPLWRWVSAGCHPNRDIAHSIQEAGLAIQQLEWLKPEPPVPPMVFTRPHIRGVAIPESRGVAIPESGQLPESRLKP